MTEAEAIQAVQALGAGSPEAVRLARAVSLASRVEPVLLRTARLRLVPTAHASDEADLWFSALVEARGPASMVLAPAAASLLRAELRQDPDLLRRAWSVVAEVHAGAPRAVQIEEHVTYLGLAGAAPDEIQRLLGEIVRALLEPGRAGLARWASTLVERVPDEVLRTDAARLLAGASAAIASGGTPATGAGGGGPSAAGAAWTGAIAALAGALGRVTLQVSLAEDRLRVEHLGPWDPTAAAPSVAANAPAPSPQPLHALPAPATTPAYLEMEQDGRTTAVRVDPGRPASLPVGPGDVLLRTLAGDAWTLRAAPLATSPPPAERDASRWLAWWTPGHPRRRLVELAAYLGDPDAVRITGRTPGPLEPGALVEGLLEWGLAAPCAAAVAAALAWNDPRLHRQLELVDPFSPALDCLRDGSIADAERLRQAVEPGEPLEAGPQPPEDPTRALEVARRANAEAALAVAAAFLGGRDARASAMGHVREALRMTPAPQRDVRTAIGQLLLAEARREQGFLSRRGDVPELQVAVLGRDPDHPDLARWTAAELGKALGREGCRLVTAGREGPEQLAAQAFAVEADLGTGDGDERLTHVVPRGAPAPARGAATPSSDWPQTAGLVASGALVVGNLTADELELGGAAPTVVPLPWTSPATRDLHLALVRRARPGDLAHLRFADLHPRGETGVREAVHQLARWVRDQTTPAAARGFRDLEAWLALKVVVARDVAEPDWNAVERFVTGPDAAPAAHWIAAALVACARAPRWRSERLPWLAQWIADRAIPVADALAVRLTDVELLGSDPRKDPLLQAVAVAIGGPARLGGWFAAALGAELDPDAEVAPLAPLVAAAARAMRAADGLEGPRAVGEDVEQRVERAPRPASEVVFELSRQADAFASAGPKLERAIRTYVRSRDPAVRLAGYVLAAKVPSSLPPADDAELLGAERAFASEDREIRPLFALLLALQARGAPVPPRAIEDLRSALESMQAPDAFEVLKVLAGLSPGGAHAPLEQRLDAIATEYEGVRASMRGGARRTRALDELLARAEREAAASDEPVDPVARFMKQREGDRVVALAVVAGRKDPMVVTIVSDTIIRPESEFEQYWALRAALALVPVLDRSGLAALQAALESTRRGRASIPRSEASDRGRLLLAVEAAIAARRAGPEGPGPAA